MAVGEGCLRKARSSPNREPVSAFSGEQWPQLTQPLLTQATGWGPQQKGSRLNLKNVPDGGIRSLGSGVEARLGGLRPLRPQRGEPQHGEASVCVGWLGEGPSCLEAGRGIG